jgi:type VI secretion system protein ImpA
MDDADAEEEGASGELAGEPTIFDAWLQPLDGEACGDDLEYDNDFLELNQAAAGKPETAVGGPAEPPDWRAVVSKAEALFERTRDLRVAVLWARGRVTTVGWTTLPDSLRLVHGLLERFWDELHPRLDDGDAYARINALEALNSSDALLADLRQAPILSGGAGELLGRNVEIALERMPPRDDESPLSRGQIEQMLRHAAGDDAALPRLASDCIARLNSITELLRERVGYESAPGFEALLAVLRDLQQVLPSADGDYTASAAADDDSASDAGAPRRSRSAVNLGERLESREDALRAIDMVCEYLERTEPTNPAQLLLRRAERLVNMNFIELVRELAPEALGEVSRVMGVPFESESGGEAS